MSGNTEQRGFVVDTHANDGRQTLIMSDKGRAYIAALLYSCTIGFSFFAVKVALRSAGPLDVLSHRFIVAFASALIATVFGRARLGVGLRELAPIVPLAIFNPVGFFLFQTLGLLFIPSSEAGIIQATLPAFTLLIALVLLGERTNARQIAYVVLSVGGVFFITLMNDAGAEAYDMRGVALILCGTLSMALYAVLTRRMAARYSVHALTFTMSAVGCVAFVAASFVMHAMHGTFADFVAPLSNGSYIAAIVFLGFASSYLSSFFSNYTLSKLQASQMSVFSNLATVIAMATGTLFLAEPFHWYHAVGALVIVIGVLGTNRYAETARKK